jgi:hypothetical protein
MVNVIGGVKVAVKLWITGGTLSVVRTRLQTRPTRQQKRESEHKGLVLKGQFLGSVTSVLTAEAIGARNTGCLCWPQYYVNRLQSTSSTVREVQDSSLAIACRIVSRNQVHIIEAAW